MAPVMPEPGTEKRDESRNVSRPQDEKGRDYYEFKEEIQYIRYNSTDFCPCLRNNTDQNLLLFSFFF